MPIYTYECQECSAQTDILRPYAAREENGRCGDCAGIADYAGLCSPAIHSEKQTAVHLEDGSRWTGTFGPAPKKFRQRPVTSKAQ